ncbi:MAG: VWA domain-containing protein [Myxococcales bacterium]|nr:VWA domain-containing protein [Myxococcales bacterium]
MLIDFLFELRRQRVNVSSHEWMGLMEAMGKGLHNSSLDGFYRLARCICVKDISDFDAFDQAFLSYFKHVYVDVAAVTDDLLDWLRDPNKFDGLSEEERKMLQSLGLEELKRMFEERLKEQDERHDGGGKWIGTGGKSPFGHGGYHPSGVRIGGPGGGRSAMQVAEMRRFRDYRKDRVLDVRQIDVALRGLRRLGREGAVEDLDLDQTVDATCKNAGDLELVYTPPKRNRMKLILLMDVGGSMDPFSRLVEQLFTAASRTGRFASFEHYYFHNCVYENIYEDAAFHKPVAVADLIARTSRDERLVVVGDALMHPGELMSPGGSIYFYHHNAAAGATWLRRLEDHYRFTAWLNPEPHQYWPRTTIEAIASIFPMYHLSLEGLEDAIRHLVRGGQRPDPVGAEPFS